MANEWSFSWFIEQNEESPHNENLTWKAEIVTPYGTYHISDEGPHGSYQACAKCIEHAIYDWGKNVPQMVIQFQGIRKPDSKPGTVYLSSELPPNWIIYEMGNEAR